MVGVLQPPSTTEMRGVSSRFSTWALLRARRSLTPNHQMLHKSSIVVLIGSQTSSRPWVLYEIGKPWDDKRSLVGVKINGLADKNKRTDSAGCNPFAKVLLHGGGTVADHVPVYTSFGRSSQQVHASINANLTSWVSNGYRRQ